MKRRFSWKIQTSVAALLVLLSTGPLLAEISSPGPGVVSSEAPDLPAVVHGEVVRWTDLTSAELAPRLVDIWLPPGYSTERRYPVIYMHDGQMLFDATRSWNKQEWGVDEVLGSLITDGEIPPVIVVGIWNVPGTRHGDYFPQRVVESLDPGVWEGVLQRAPQDTRTVAAAAGIRSDAYLRFIVEQVKPRVDATFATAPGRETTFVMGSSMGGLISLYALCEYPKVFGGAACLSTHWIGFFFTGENPLPEAFAAYVRMALPDPGAHRLYFDFGTETLDAHYEPHQLRIDAILRERGYPDSDWVTRKFAGAPHTEYAWRSRLEIPVRFLLGSAPRAASE